jgi:hypothetical protein
MFKRFKVFILVVSLMNLLTLTPVFAQVQCNPNNTGSRCGPEICSGCTINGQQGSRTVSYRIDCSNGDIIGTCSDTGCVLFICY